jgi:hypothetical protein
MAKPTPILAQIVNPLARSIRRPQNRQRLHQHDRPTMADPIVRLKPLSQTDNFEICYSGH